MVDFAKQINPFNTCTLIFMKEMLALRISLRQFQEYKNVGNMIELINDK